LYSLEQQIFQKLQQIYQELISLSESRSDKAEYIDWIKSNFYSAIPLKLY
jgi:hypothetical protein